MNIQIIHCNLEWIRTSTLTSVLGLSVGFFLVWHLSSLRHMSTIKDVMSHAATVSYLTNKHELSKYKQLTSMPKTYLKQVLNLLKMAELLMHRYMILLVTGIDMSLLRNVVLNQMDQL